MRLFRNKEKTSIDLLKERDKTAQRQFYEKNVGQFLMVSRIYIKDLHYAEDCVVKAFCKIFSNIDAFQNKGSFEGWARRILVNECLNFIKTQKKILYIDETNIDFDKEEEDFNVNEDFDALSLIDKLPDNYKMIFNLSVLEEMSHQEISKMLNISVSASKVQLFRAKQKLKDLYLNLNKKQNEI
ncbi:MAG: RNA polymerase sigma factor [Bergeyella zoohelcum]|nr:RNA polymerase sigma factor [Bergeyella zoohelcum]